MIILTGGAGFIGSNILTGLNRKGLNQVIVVDNLKNGSKHLNLNARQFQDYLPKERLLEELPRLGHIELILHQGACSSTTELDGQYMMANNYEFSKKLLIYCLEHKVPMVYASSASVYGNGDRGFNDASDDFFPLNIYAYSKLLFDRMVRKVLSRKENAAALCGLRYFNVYGYQENHKGDMASVPFKFFRQHQEGSDIALFEGSDGFVRDFIFVEDVVDMVLFFMERGHSGIFNAGTGAPRSFQDMADIFQHHFPMARIKQIPFPTHLTGKYQAFTSADLNNVRATGYIKTFCTLEEGMSRYINQLKETGGYLI